MRVALPNQGSLLYWASAANITLALLLLLARLLAEGRLTQPTLLPASVLCYEATLPAAVVGLVIVPRLRTGRWEPRALGCEEWTVAAGFVTDVVGTLPFARYFYGPVQPPPVRRNVAGALHWSTFEAMANLAAATRDH